MPKQTKNKAKNTATKTLTTIISHKLLSVLVVILVLVIGIFAYNKYLDWDNAQMIKGLSKDFPLLVEQIEQETGLELEIQSNCMTTTEKFSEGVRTCEYLVVENPVNIDSLHKQNNFLDHQEVFKRADEFQNKEGFHFQYRNKNSCTFRYSDYIYLSCITGVRDANVPKIRELLSGN